MSTIEFPWHQSAWHIVNRAIAAKTLPQAWLVGGPRGMGKRQFANELVRRLVCETTPETMRQACGHCAGCKLVKAGSHPDVRVLELEEEEHSIPVERVREIVRFTGLTTQQARQKVVIVDPAEKFNLYGANALLKTLEEPPGEAVFILISHNPGRLPATIKSRCQSIAFTNPDYKTTVDWLVTRNLPLATAQQLVELFPGSPLLALAGFQQNALQAYSGVATDLFALAGERADPVATAKRWADGAGARQSLEYAWEVIRQTIREAQAGRQREGSSTASLSAALDIPMLYDLLDHCIRSLRVILTQTGYNEKLLLESFAARVASVHDSDDTRLF